MDIKKYKYTSKNKFNVSKTSTKETGNFKSKNDVTKLFQDNLERINELQQSLYADRKEGVIFIFQAMDAAGKDGTIRAVLSCLSPHGVHESCFKKPTAEELAHDYLWRFWKALPEKGHIAIFNRSYYEDVLIGKVHKLYENQLHADRIDISNTIEKRYEEINSFEQYLYNNSTRIVKIFLNVSKDEQARRFISRIDTPKKNWKISEADIEERKYWEEYQKAFEDAINATATKMCPWYVVPADNKWYMRYIVSEIILQTLEEMNPSFPVVDKSEISKISKYRNDLIQSLSKKEQTKYK